MRNLHLGTIGWSYSFWKGNFYPSKTPAKGFLSYYSTQFDTVEVDSTFYRLPTPQTVRTWKQQTPDGFVFSLKFPQAITHVRMLRDSEQLTETFLDRAGLLEEKLGPLLLQFPPSFAANRLPDLEAFLKKLPQQHRYVVEVRNKSWLNQTVYSLLKAHKVALAWAESPLMWQIREVTADFIYIRWEGDRKKVNGTLGKVEVDRKGDLEAWAKELKRLIRKDVDVFGYFGKYFSGLPPSDARLLSTLVP